MATHGSFTRTEAANRARSETQKGIPKGERVPTNSGTTSKNVGADIKAKASHTNQGAVQIMDGGTRIQQGAQVFTEGVNTFVTTPILLRLDDGSITG